MGYKIKLALVLLLTVSSCANYSESIETPMNFVTQTISPPATHTATTIPTPTNTPDPYNSAQLIQYDINKDIWIKVGGKTEDSNPVYFAFSGIEGQQIQIYIDYKPFYDGGLIWETKIVDRNGNMIESEAVSSPSSWYGVLPSTQDYLILLKPFDSKKTEFILKLVNTPPRQESGYFTYRDEQAGFEITYSQDDFTPFGNNGSTVFSVTLDTDRYFKDTILQQSNIEISTEPDIPDTKCSGWLSERYYSTKENINGISFEKFSLHDAATGTEAELLNYFTTHDGNCFSIFVRTLYIRVDKFPDTGLEDFSRSVLYTKIYRLLNTFKFIE